MGAMLAVDELECLSGALSFPVFFDVLRITVHMQV
jgi:hypothetical protein